MVVPAWRAPAKKSGISYAYHVDRQKVRMAQKRAAAQLPGDWLSRIDFEARSQRCAYAPSVWSAGDALAVWEKWLNEFGGAAAADLSDAGVKKLAEVCEREAQDLGLGVIDERGAWVEYARIIEFCAVRGVDAPGPVYLLRGIAARVCCRYWWRRALRKMIARKCERGAMRLGIVSKPNRQAYASNKAVFRRLDQNKRNAVMLEKTVLENEDGMRATLADLAARSVARKSVRRGELMTRIRGCEEIADASGHVGVFLTLTCPSRFHSTLRDGRRNPHHDGSTPVDGQKWLCRMWARARAKLKRQGVNVYGFRVAEPHHDGCVHWHALLWCASAHDVGQLVRVVRHHWLSDGGDEPGAKKNRINAKRMDRGGAAGYIAKYIAKNIDGHAVGEYLDDYAESPIHADLLGDLEITPSMRVEAWASHWGIRQFQAIGQPPVTVWRELRRVTQASASAAGKGGVLHRAWVAAQGPNGARGSLGEAARAQRVEADARASWADYCNAQGGVMCGRAYKVAVAVEVVEVEGRYGSCKRQLPRGVRLNWPGTRCVYSERRAWRSVSASASADFCINGFERPKAAPWTRVNNCTDHNKLRPKMRASMPTVGAGGMDYWITLERIRVREGRPREAGQLIKGYVATGGGHGFGAGGVR